ncbi:MAG: hypothetical protein EA377_01940 [Phycisphaerales bacterium]|nr:MAG: hypothetical protein EA377_01940 [Phycisphaerales bacterium]
MSESFDRQPEYSGAYAELSADDQRLLDALLESGFDVDGMEPLTERERVRAERLNEMFGLLHDYPVDDADDTLIAATMVRIDRLEETERRSYQLEAAGQGGGGGRFLGMNLRRPDFIGVAAAGLLAVSVLWPMANAVHQRSIDESCRNNLRLTSYGFSQYASDHNGHLPVARAGYGGGKTWDRISNRINLNPLIEGQYCSHGHLNCPGHHEDLKIGYSYQWQRPDSDLRWGVGRVTVIMGDRNPLIENARRGVFIPALSVSNDHGGRGQNTLSTDGSVMWLAQPVIGRGDNIWLPHGMDRLEPGAVSQDDSDVFLTH